MERGISVVICCYNSELKIPKVLSCLQDQQFKSQVDWEILLVDNASTDRTESVARECWSDEGVKLRVVLESNPGLSHARRRGFDESRFEIISFVDDDNWVEAEWIQKVYDTMYSDPEIGMLGGMGTAAFEGDFPEWFPRFQDSYAVGPQAKKSGERHSPLYGAGMNIRKSTWEMLGQNGFRFQLTGRKGKLLSSGEDSELSFAILLSGRKLYYRSDLTFYHFMPSGRLSWDYLMKLTGAFGRAEPILGVYRSFLKGDKDFTARKYQNRFFSLLRTSFDILKFIPVYIRLLFIRKEGEVDQRHGVFLWNSFKAKILLYRSFPSIVSEIREGEWNKCSLD